MVTERVLLCFVLQKKNSTVFQRRLIPPSMNRFAPVSIELFSFKTKSISSAISSASRFINNCFCNFLMVNAIIWHTGTIWKIDAQGMGSPRTGLRPHKINNFVLLGWQKFFNVKYFYYLAKFLLRLCPSTPVY